MQSGKVPVSKGTMLQCTVYSTWTVYSVHSTLTAVCPMCASRVTICIPFVPSCAPFALAGGGFAEGPPGLLLPAPRWSAPFCVLSTVPFVSLSRPPLGPWQVVGSLKGHLDYSSCRSL